MELINPKIAPSAGPPKTILTASGHKRQSLCPGTGTGIACSNGTRTSPMIAGATSDGL
jgi:hypothetical protein